MTTKLPAEVRANDPCKISETQIAALSKMSGSQDPRFSLTLMSSVLAATWFPSDTSEQVRNEKIAVAITALEAFEPKNAVEGMMAAQAVALHLAAMECFRRAMLPNQPGEAAMRLWRDGANLARAMADMVEAIERRRGKRPQVVRVERVVVNEGGQAIVGTVSSGANGRNRGEGDG